MIKIDHTLYLMLNDLHIKTDQNTQKVQKIEERINTLIEILTEEALTQQEQTQETTRRNIKPRITED